VYERFNHIFQMLDEAMNLTHDIESTPFNVGRIQFLMARAASEINILDLVISQLEEGVQKALMPPEVNSLCSLKDCLRIFTSITTRCGKRSGVGRTCPKGHSQVACCALMMTFEMFVQPRDEVGIRIYTALECRSWQTSILARVSALKNLMTDAQRKVGYIRRFTDLVNKHELYHSVRRTGNHSYRLCKNTEITSLKAKNAWIAQYLLGILLIIKIGGKYRTGIFGCNMLPMIKEVAVELTDTLFLYNFYEQPGRIYSERCPWVNDWQRWHIDNPWMLVISVVGIAVSAAFIIDTLGFFLQKRRSKAIQNSQMSWRAGHGTEKMGRICHRFEALIPFNEDNLYLYMKDKHIKAKNFRREVLPGAKINGHKEMDEYCTLILVQWVETDSKAWNGLPPIVTVIFEQEIGFVRSIKFDVKKRVSGLQIDEAWAILRKRWVAAQVIKREHSTPAALQAHDGKWASVDVEARKAAAEAANIAVAEANGERQVMSKKEKAKMLKKQQEEAAQSLMDEFKASQKRSRQQEQAHESLQRRKGLGRQVAADWKREYKDWQAGQKVGAAERHAFHKAAKKRVIQKLMRPTLWDAIGATFAGLVAGSKAKKSEGVKGDKGKEDDGDLEAGGGGGEEDEEDGKASHPSSGEEDSDSEGGGEEGSKGRAKRATSSRGSRADKGLSEAETEAERTEPQDSDDD